MDKRLLAECSSSQKSKARFDARRAKSQKVKIIETYYEDKPFPSFLILGYTEDKRPLHMVIGVNSEDFELYFITAYQPMLEIWEEGFERRKKR